MTDTIIAASPLDITVRDKTICRAKVLYCQNCGAENEIPKNTNINEKLICCGCKTEFLPREIMDMTPEGDWKSNRSWAATIGLGARWPVNPAW